MAAASPDLDEKFPCHLLVDPPLDGPTNMARDEVLMRQVAASQVACLRFYRWSQPTLSLGYFQRAADADCIASQGHLAVVRRISGGGALLHDREITYSLCLPLSHPVTNQSDTLYELVHNALIDAFKPWLPQLQLHGQTPQSSALRGKEPLLCFQRRSTWDVVASSGPAPSPQAGETAAPKIAGSAQRRTRGVLLQHGAVLLDQSPDAPPLPGIAQLTSVLPSCEELIGRWSSRLAQALGLQWSGTTRWELPAAEVAALVAAKYGNSTWTGRR
jgi:lipoate-protein ligase A